MEGRVTGHIKSRNDGHVCFLKPGSDFTGLYAITKFKLNKYAYYCSTKLCPAAGRPFILYPAPAGELRLHPFLPARRKYQTSTPVSSFTLRVSLGGRAMCLARSQLSTCSSPYLHPDLAGTQSIEHSCPCSQTPLQQGQPAYEAKFTILL